MLNYNQTLDNLLEQYDSISDGIDKVKPEPIFLEAPEDESENIIQSPINEEVVVVQTHHSDNNQVLDSIYNLRASYSLSFPVNTGFREYQMEYDWGHHLEVKIHRNWDSFFLGLSLGFKAFENKQLSMPYTVGSMELPADGSNQSLFTSLSIGIEHFLNNRTFITGSAGLGFGKAWDEISVGGVDIFDDSDYFFYGMLQLGIGYALDDSYSLLAFYQFDAQGSRSHFEAQYFNQIGLGLGIHY
jgi:hypothetical protein